MTERAPLEPPDLDAIEKRWGASTPTAATADITALRAHIKAQDARIEYLENDKSQDAAIADMVGWRRLARERERRIEELEENARSNPDGVDGMRRTIEALGRVNAEQQRRIAELEQQRDDAQRLLNLLRTGERKLRAEQQSEIDRYRELLRELTEAAERWISETARPQHVNSAVGRSRTRRALKKVEAALSERPK